ncbi:putative lipoprotein [Castellaniella defragrans 65Phen]|jgi:osmotically-inducible protein OsmY|uniref:Putative lipoprotein n=1 Tax=Castellaniella defragrans (strain DSM 12143 / CCUG 39792 / 65Phen) TaxID=1437824 RepID=W8X3U1_CASD6|nr:BON domain-containing protein [Castellaniella defragrans]CDM23976.1 putative lipoprotein [Castellaniella defragrans 65Phen]
MKSNIARLVAMAAMAGAAAVMASGCSVARKQETVGQYIDGSAVTAEVKAKLANDPATSAANINVKTIDGGTVQLSGFAKSQHEKDRAGELARSVKGVTSVHNGLVVKP